MEIFLREIHIRWGVYPRRNDNRHQFAMLPRLMCMFSNSDDMWFWLNAVQNRDFPSAIERVVRHGETGSARPQYSISHETIMVTL
jgi:hypothetical protein